MQHVWWRSHTLHGEIILLQQGLQRFFETPILRVYLKSALQEGPIHLERRLPARCKRGKRNTDLPQAARVLESNPERTCSLFSAQQIDQKRRDQNRNERPGAIEAKENGEHQGDNDEAH